MRSNSRDIPARVDGRPGETGTVWWVLEIVDIVLELAERSDDRRLELVSPGGCDVDLHGRVDGVPLVESIADEADGAAQGGP